MCIRDSQKAGCGFPVPKVLALFDAFSGMVLEALCLPLCSHEQSGVWRLHPMLGPGDLLVGDRPGRKPRRKGQRGRPRSRVVRRLGKHDQVVAWPKPGKRPKWMAMLAAQFQSLPAELHVRELRYRLGGRGRRTRVVTIATTLLDPERYPREKVAQLY